MPNTDEAFKWAPLDQDDLNYLQSRGIDVDQVTNTAVNKIPLMATNVSENVQSQISQQSQVLNVLMKFPAKVDGTKDGGLPMCEVIWLACFDAMAIALAEFDELVATLNGYLLFVMLIVNSARFLVGKDDE